MFFRGLRQHLPKKLQDRLVIKVESTSTVHLLEQAEEVIAYNVQYRRPWIIFDRDRVLCLTESFRMRSRGGSMSDGPIRVLKYGFIRTLERCPSLMNQRNAVGGEMNFGIEWGALIKEQILICMKVF